MIRVQQRHRQTAKETDERRNIAAQPHSAAHRAVINIVIVEHHASHHAMIDIDCT